MRTRGMAVLALAAVVAVGGSTAAARQVELDRIVGRVGDRIITQSDIRRARTLHLVDDVSSDDAVRRQIENRTLELNELGRGQPLPPPSDADLAARRAAWQASVGGAERAQAVLRETGMTPGELDAWLRDDVLIQMYVARQFGRVPPDQRAKAQSDWVARLRTRAGLP